MEIEQVSIRTYYVRLIAYVTEVAKTGHIGTNHTCLENNRLAICFLIDFQENVVTYLQHFKSGGELNFIKGSCADMPCHC